MRVIHRFDFKGKDVVKGINYEGLRPIANIENLLSAWMKYNIQEIFFQGATASLHNKYLENEIVKITKEVLSLPITVGGGIKSLAIAKKILNMGSDRVAINTGFFLNNFLLEEIIENLGESTIVVSIDVSKINNQFYCFINNGRDNTKVNLAEHLKKISEIGNPEIFITNIDRDGLCNGIDSKLLKEISSYKGPIVISGGICSTDDIMNIRKILPNKSNGVGIGRAFHNFILEKDIDVGHNLAFASKFEYRTGKRKEESISISPEQIKEFLKREFS